MRKKLLLLFSILFIFSVSKSQVTGTDTICAGAVYRFDAYIAGADSFNWIFPGGWVIMNGADSSHCEAYATLSDGYFYVTGFDSTGIAIKKIMDSVFWGGTGGNIQTTLSMTPVGPCPCSGFVLQLLSTGGTGGCTLGCGFNSYTTGCIIQAIYDGPWPTGNYWGPLGSFIPYPTIPTTYYLLTIDTVLGLNNAILVDGGGCGSGSANSITISPCTYPTLMLGCSSPNCAGDTVSITLSLQWGSIYLNPVSWTTNSPNATLFNTTGSSANIVCTAAETLNVYCSGFDFAGCPFSGSTVIEFKSCPLTAGLTSTDTSVCQNETIDFYDLSTDYPASWQWYFPGALPDTSTLQNPTGILYPDTGTFDVSLIACNSLYCDTITLPGFIYVNPALPAPVISQNIDTLFATPGNWLYQWYKNGLPIPGANDSICIINSNALYMVVISDSNNNCTNSDTLTVYCNTCFIPVIKFSASDSIICEKQHINFTDLSTKNPSSWTWSFPGAFPSASPSQNPAGVYYPAAGNMDVTLTAANVNGSSTLTMNGFIKVNPLPPTPIVSIWNDTLVASPGNWAYQWYKNGNPLQGANDSILGLLSSGTYTLYITDSNGCSSSTSVYANCSGCLPPSSVFYSSDTLLCEKNCIGFFDLSVNNPTSWHWYFPDAYPDTSTEQNPNSICFSVYGSYDISFKACNAFGCDSVYLSNFIAVLTKPTAPVITQSNDTLYSTHAYSYKWFEVSGPATVLSTDSFLVITQNGSYYVLVGDSTGCEKVSNVITISTGLSELNNHSSIVIHPDPSTDGNFNIAYSLPVNKEGLLQIIDMTGNVVFKYILPHQSREQSFKLPGLTSGIYNCMITSGSERTSKKLVVAKE